MATERIKDIDILGSIQLIAEKTENIPMWTINYYLQELCNNYNKIVYIRKICEKLQNGILPSKIWIAKKSGELLPNKIEILKKTQKMAEILDVFSMVVSFLPDDIIRILFDIFKGILSSTYAEEKIKEHFYILSKDGEHFWNHLIDEPRPLVFINAVYSKTDWAPLIIDDSTNKDGLVPLIDFSSEEAIKITSMNYNSPLALDTQGLINGLIDLAYAGQRNEREVISFISDQIGKSAENIGKITRTSQIINDERTPIEYKQYAEASLKHLSAYQAMLNESLGIRLSKIDIKV